jgi:hypothetical protein
MSQRLDESGIEAPFADDEQDRDVGVIDRAVDNPIEVVPHEKTDNDAATEGSGLWRECS